MIYQHNSLFLHLVDALIDKVNISGFISLHSTSARIVPSTSRCLKRLLKSWMSCPKNYLQLTDEEKIHVLAALSQTSIPAQLDAGVRGIRLRVFAPSRRSSNITGGKDAAVILSANAIVH